MNLSKRLGIVSNVAVLTMNAPEAYFESLEPLPAGVEIRTFPRGNYRFLHFFARTKKELDRFIEVATVYSVAGGKIWLSYPFRSEVLATYFRSKAYSKKMTESGLSVAAMMPLDRQWIAFRIRQENKRQPNQALQTTRLARPEI